MSSYDRLPYGPVYGPGSITVVWVVVRPQCRFRCLSSMVANDIASLNDLDVAMHQFCCISKSGALFGL